MTTRCVWCGRFKRDICSCEEERLYKVAGSVVYMATLTTLILHADDTTEMIKRLNGMFHGE